MNILNKNTFVYPEKKQNLILGILLLVGFGLRLFHLIYNRSLWMDEVYLSTSLVKMNFIDLITKPLYYEQKAPVGFLSLVKLCTTVFGNNEMALRLIPFISSLVAILIFIPIAKFYLRGWASLLAIAILCLSPALIYHAVEIKQYATELLATVLSLYFMVKFRDQQSIYSRVIWGVYGALMLWFSYAAIFILAGIGIGLSLNYILQKKYHLFLLNLIPSSIWALSFLMNYLLFTHRHAESEWIAYWFNAYHNFMPFPPKSLPDVKWFAVNIYRMIDYPLGLLWNFLGTAKQPTVNIILKMPFIPIGLLLYGILIFFKKNKHEMTILSMGILFMFLASGLKLYPLTERFWVFIAPVFIILLAKGFEACADRIKSKFISSFVFVMLLTGPLVQSFAFTIDPSLFYVHKKSYQREALTYIDDQFKEGDLVYIYWNNLPGYRIYKEMYDLKYKAFEGSDFRYQAHNSAAYYNLLQPELKALEKGERIWVVFNTVFLTDIGDRIDEPDWYYQNNHNPTISLKKELLKSNKLLKMYVTKDITVCLLKTIKK